MASESGLWSICRFEFSEEAEVPDRYFMLSWSYDSQDEAAEALSGVAEDNNLSKDKLVIVYSVFPHDLAEQAD